MPGGNSAPHHQFLPSGLGSLEGLDSSWLAADKILNRHSVMLWAEQKWQSLLKLLRLLSSPSLHAPPLSAWPHSSAGGPALTASLPLTHPRASSAPRRVMPSLRRPCLPATSICQCLPPQGLVIEPSFFKGSASNSLQASCKSLTEPLIESHVIKASSYAGPGCAVQQDFPRIFFGRSAVTTLGQST
jgi:hypothetical protein